MSYHYFRLKLGRRTVYLYGERKPSGWYFGRKVNPVTLEDASRLIDGVVYDKMELIAPWVVTAVEEMYSDLRYGGLTTVPVDAQKAAMEKGTND
jgi:hypothetical protein